MAVTNRQASITMTLQGLGSRTVNFELTRREANIIKNAHENPFPKVDNTQRAERMVMDWKDVNFAMTISGWLTNDAETENFAGGIYSALTKEFLLWRMSLEKGAATLNLGYQDTNSVRVIGGGINAFDDMNNIEFIVQKSQTIDDHSDTADKIITLDRNTGIMPFTIQGLLNIKELT